MAISAVVFYTGNVLLFTMYLVLAALSRRPGGVNGKSTSNSFERGLSVVFFLLAAGLHADMAYHAVTLTPFFVPPFGGHIAWDFTLLVFAKCLVAVTFMIYTAVQARRKRAPK